jgi:hypothetical protein
MSEAVESPKPDHAVGPRRAQSSRLAKAEVSTLTIITTLVVLLVFVGLVWLVFLQRQTIPTGSSLEREERLKNLAQLNADNQKALTTYHWMDKSKGVVGIPINRAMELVLKDLAANHPHAAGPINPPAATPTPAVANQPAASPTPAATNQPAASPTPAATNPPAANPTPAANNQPAAATPAPSASATPAASPASSPSSSPEPTATPAPTASPEQTTTPEPSPSPTAQ